MKENRESGGFKYSIFFCCQMLNYLLLIEIDDYWLSYIFFYVLIVFNVCIIIKFYFVLFFGLKFLLKLKIYIFTFFAKNVYFVSCQ